MTSDRADASEQASAQKYPSKTSFYQGKARSDRMRAAFMATRDITGFKTLSDYINAAVDGQTAALEAAHNGGQPWTPVGAGEIPQGKPVGGNDAGLVSSFRAPAGKLSAHVGEVVYSLRALTGAEVINVLYAGSSRALLECTDSVGRMASFHNFEMFYSGRSPIEGRSSGRVAWSPLPAEGVPSALVAASALRRPSRALFVAVEQFRASVAERVSDPGAGEVQVYSSEDGLRYLVEVFDAGEQESTFRAFRQNTATGLIEVSVCDGVAWKDAA